MLFCVLLLKVLFVTKRRIKDQLEHRHSPYKPILQAGLTVKWVWGSHQSGIHLDQLCCGLPIKQVKFSFNHFFFFILRSWLWSRENILWGFAPVNDCKFLCLEVVKHQGRVAWDMRCTNILFLSPVASFHWVPKYKSSLLPGSASAFYMYSHYNPSSSNYISKQYNFIKDNLGLQWPLWGTLHLKLLI